MSLRDIPRVLVMADVNTTRGGTLYEANRAAIDSLAHLGLWVFIQPYATPIDIQNDDDALAIGLSLTQLYSGYLSLGGIFQTPASFYADGKAPPRPDGVSWSPEEKRFPLDAALMRAFLYTQKPILSICGGAQVLAGICDCKLGSIPDHWTPGQNHPLALKQNTRLYRAMKTTKLEINSTHREGIVQTAPRVRVAARAPDGVIEAIEIKNHPFALGIMGHPEKELTNPQSPWFSLFKAFAKAVRTASL